MIIKIDDWTFEIDLDATMAYSAQEAQGHCTCGYCRNFYASVDIVYPNLRPFLAEFGVHIEAPDELIPYEPTLMEGSYAVCGRIMGFGSQPIEVDGLGIGIMQPHEVHLNTGCPGPFFVLNTGLMELPWVLDEAMEDVISPANDPNYIEEINERILTSYPQDNIQ